MTIKEWQDLVKDDPTELACIRRVQADAIRDAARAPKDCFESYVERDKLLHYAEEVEAGKN